MALRRSQDEAKIGPRSPQDGLKIVLKSDRFLRRFFDRFLVVLGSFWGRLGVPRWSQKPTQERLLNRGGRPCARQLLPRPPEDDPRPPKSAPRRPKTPKMTAQDAPRGAKRPPRRPKMTPNDPLRTTQHKADKTRQQRQGQDKTEQDKRRQDTNTTQDKTGQDKRGQDKTRQDKTR